MEDPLQRVGICLLLYTPGEKTLYGTPEIWVVSHLALGSGVGMGDVVGGYTSLGQFLMNNHS